MTLSWQSDKQTSNLRFGWLRCYWPWPYHSCVICVREFTHWFMVARKVRPTSFLGVNKEGTETFQGWWWSFCSCHDKTLYERRKKNKTDQCGSGAGSKKQVKWITWNTLLSKNLDHVKSSKRSDFTKYSSPAYSLNQKGPLIGHLA